MYIKTHYSRLREIWRIFLRFGPNSAPPMRRSAFRNAPFILGPLEVPVDRLGEGLWSWTGEGNGRSRWAVLGPHKCVGGPVICRIFHSTSAKRDRTRSSSGCTGDSTNSRASATSSGPRSSRVRRSPARERNAIGLRSCFRSWNAGSTWRRWRIDRYCSVMSRTIADSPIRHPVVSCEIRMSSRKRSRRVANGHVDKVPPWAHNSRPVNTNGLAKFEIRIVTEFFFESERRSYRVAGARKFNWEWNYTWNYNSFLRLPP